MKLVYAVLVLTAVIYAEHRLIGPHNFYYLIFISFKKIVREMMINNKCRMALIIWSEKLQMLFDFEIYKCLRTGHGNTG